MSAEDGSRTGGDNIRPFCLVSMKDLNQLLLGFPAPWFHVENDQPLQREDEFGSSQPEKRLIKMQLCDTDMLDQL